MNFKVQSHLNIFQALVLKTVKRGQIIVLLFVSAVKSKLIRCLTKRRLHSSPFHVNLCCPVVFGLFAPPKTPLMSYCMKWRFLP